MIPRIHSKLLINTRRTLQSLCGCRIRPFSTDGRDESDNTVNDVRSENTESSRTSSSETVTSSSLKDLLNEAEVLTEQDVEPEFPSDVTEKQLSGRNYSSWQKSQEKHAFRPKVDPKETSIFLFPGQGSQFVGMASKLLPYPNVREMFEIASDVLGYDLLKLCLKGPKSALDSTVYCQPAIFVTSLAAVEKLRDDNPQAIENCISTAGFSIGEYAALVFSGVLSFEDGMELVRVRAEAMQEASNAVGSGMMSVFLRPDSRLKFACHAAKLHCQKNLGMDNPVCSIANFLYPECKVIAGNEEALQFIQKNSSEFSLARIRRLPVSGAFHTQLMKEAKTPLLKAMSRIQFRRPLIPVFSNVTSHRYKHPKTIIGLLAEQLYKPVKWEQIMHVLYSRKQGEDFPFTYELGPGRQLGTLLKMTNKKAHEQYKHIDV